MNTVIYARQSLDRDGLGAAVDRQLADCRKLARAHKLKVSMEFVDNDVSASKGLRPDFIRMLSLIKAGEIDTIIVWHTDRLYRRVRDLVEIVETAEKNALRILTVRAGDLDLATPAGRMLAGMLGQVARYEVEQKGARQVAANLQRAAAGKWQFSNRPFGYERVDGAVQIVETEAAALREAYDRYLAGESLYSIVENFNVRGIKTTKGGAWNITTLRARLSNPAYAGIRLYKGASASEEGDWEPIIDRETWDAYLTAKQRRKRPHTWSNRTKYLLSGIAICGVCGGRLMARPDYPKRKNGQKQPAKMAYACTSNWCVQRNQKLVDELVETVVIERLSRADAADAIRPKADLRPLLLESSKLRDRRSDLAQALSEGLLDLADVRVQSMNLTKQIDALQERIAAAEGDTQLGQITNAPDVAAHWNSKLSLAQKRAVIGTLMTVTINKQRNTRRFEPTDIVIDWIT